MIDKTVFENKIAAYYTLGCKLNFAETSTIGKVLAEQGVRKARPGEKADICVVNTCSVTELADKKCRQAIRRIGKQHPGAFIVVTGCYAQLKPEEVSHIEGVDLVLGAEQKLDLLMYLDDLKKREEGGAIIASRTKDIRTFSPSCSADDRTRHFLKVQDGCDYFCSYCTIPFARGRSRNGTIASMVKQAEEVASNGGKEIVLTGVNIGDFGKSTGETFIDLIRALDKVEGIVRYRISSIEPNLITDEAIDFVACSRRFAPHFHIPLQSGSDEVLKLMRRRYDTTLFRHKIERGVKRIPVSRRPAPLSKAWTSASCTCSAIRNGRVRRHSRSTTSSTRKPSMPAASNCWTYPTVSSMLSTKRISARRRMSCLNKHAKEA